MQGHKIYLRLEYFWIDTSFGALKYLLGYWDNVMMQIHVGNQFFAASHLFIKRNLNCKWNFWWTTCF